MVAVAVVVLALQVEGPVRFVDFIGFSMRARGLAEGHGRLVDPLYPVGYPLTLLVLRLVVGNVVFAGKALAVAGGALAAGAAARLLRPGAGLLLLALPATWLWGSTEGTDMPAAALCLATLAAAAGGRPATAGLLAAAACLTRYTAVAVVPAALLICGGGVVGRLRLLGALAVGSAPHWATALWLSQPVLPDQSYNLAVAAGRPTPLFSLDTLARWPGGIARAAMATAGDGVARIVAVAGGVGLLVGLARRDRRAVGIVAFALAHIALVGLAFARPRLVLPATLCLGLGIAWLAPRRWVLVPALVVLGWSWLNPTPPDPHLARLDEVVAATDNLPGPFIASDPWFHSAHDGWLQQGVPPRAAGNDRQLQPDHLVAFARREGFRFLVLDPSRVRRTYPQLAPLLERGPIDGLTLEAAPGTWRVWRVEGAEDAVRKPGPPDRTPPSLRHR